MFFTNGGRKLGGEGTENCIAITRWSNWAIFGIYVGSLGGYQYHVYHPANHVFINCSSNFETHRLRVFRSISYWGNICHPNTKIDNVHLNTKKLSTGRR